MTEQIKAKLHELMKYHIIIPNNNGKRKDIPD